MQLLSAGNVLVNASVLRPIENGFVEESVRKAWKCGRIEAIIAFYRVKVCQK